MKQRVEVELSRAEVLRVERRRADLTQAGAAALVGVTVARYKDWECGRVFPDPARAAPGPAQRAVGLSWPEWCFVQRRRAGLRLVDVGAAMGLSKKWVHRAEVGDLEDVEALVAWWRQRLELAGAQR